MPAKLFFYFKLLCKFDVIQLKTLPRHAFKWGTFSWACVPFIKAVPAIWDNRWKWKFVFDYILSYNSSWTCCSVWPCEDCGQSELPFMTVEDWRQTSTGRVWYWRLWNKGCIRALCYIMSVLSLKATAPRAYIFVTGPRVAARLYAWSEMKLWML